MSLASDRDVIELVRRARAALHSARYEIEVVREMSALIEAYDSARGSADAGGSEGVRRSESAPNGAVAPVAHPDPAAGGGGLVATPAAAVLHAARRLADLRAQKKRSMQCEYGILTCEACSRLIDTYKAQAESDYEGCHYCSGCAAELRASEAARG